MSKYRVLFNPLSCGGKGAALAQQLKERMSEDMLTFLDITQVSDYEALFSTLEEGEAVIITGGDGTLNRFINDTASIHRYPDIYYFATGTGNDFWVDIDGQKGGVPVLINSYLENLPEVIVQGKRYRFLNAIGYGIDGYCCEVADKIHAKDKNASVNYTKIAIQGALYGYHPKTATITVDGVTRTYKKTWLAPTMNGRYFGGGMKAAPHQNRLNSKHTVSVMTAHDAIRMQILVMFPSIIQGEHEKYTKHVNIFEGRDIKVQFDCPTTLQIDGETVYNVTEYEVVTCESPRYSGEKLNGKEAVLA